MRLGEYLKDKGTIILLNCIGFGILALYLYECNFTCDGIYFIGVCWGLTVCGYLIINYLMKRSYINHLLRNVAQLDKKYLITDVWKKSRTYEERIYYDILRQCNKSMMEEITSIKHDREEYQEYIEQWVHEIKTPLAAMKLIADNGKSASTRGQVESPYNTTQQSTYIRLLNELERTERFVEQALYYARSEKVSKDYLLRDTELYYLVSGAIQHNKQLLLENHLNVENECDGSVMTDRKWVMFILDQCIANSVAYGAKRIHFTSYNEGIHTWLVMKDNGIGIKQEELPRVFEKGFTGSNGRVNQKSTGFGLYICNRLCDKMNIDMNIDSVEGEYTTIRLRF